MRKELESYFDRLWPICRSITGEGLRSSFRILQEIIPLNLTEVPSGTGVFDWEVPKEWNIRDAWIRRPDGLKIAEFKVNNLHVVNYSVPVHAKLSLSELKPHLHTIPDKPGLIPYITSYYREAWGFCISHDEWLTLPEGEYEVYIDSDLEPGSMTIGDLVLPGESTREILFSSYLCHPSMANNELSGPLALAFLYRLIASIPHRHYTYRFVLAPETIGVIAYLAEHGELMKSRIEAGYVMTCCGDRGNLTYKRSKIGNTLADSMAEHILNHSGDAYSVRNFSVGGSDERQYCSPGFNMPVGSLMRSVYHEFPEYHTSADNRNFISFEHLERTIEMYYRIVSALELNGRYLNKVQFGEPMLGKRGLYPSSVTPELNRRKILLMMHFLTYADGSATLLETAEKMGAGILEFQEVVENCLKAGLVTRRKE
ncbi:MAG: hypothetical protein RL220_902 [Bacteroidota bacterium]